MEPVKRGRRGTLTAGWTTISSFTMRRSSIPSWNRRAFTAIIAIHAHTYGVYPEEIDGLKRDYEKLWGEVSKVLRELSELVAK